MTEAVEVIYREVETRFVTFWDEDRYPIAFENVDFDPTNLDMWVRLSINCSTDTAGLGGDNQGLNRTDGIINVECFVRLNEGTRGVIQVAQEAATIFQYKSFNGVICQAASIERHGRQDLWYKVTAYIPFYYDEIATI